MVRCPGQDQRFWKPGDIFEVQCTGCEKKIEFFKDEPKLKCPECGQMVVNPKIDLGCAEWCQYAEQCLGVSFVKNLRVIRDKLIDKMKKIFVGDKKRIDHALAVLNYAEQIQAAEGGDPLIVRAAAILHDIGIYEAERKHGLSEARYQEIEGPPVAREILTEFDLDEAVVEHVCKIIANHHSAKDIDTLEFRIIWDADRLVNLSTDFTNVSKEKRREFIDKAFKTHSGHQIAVERFIKTEAGTH